MIRIIIISAVIVLGLALNYLQRSHAEALTSCMQLHSEDHCRYILR